MKFRLQKILNFKIGIQELAMRDLAEARYQLDKQMSILNSYYSAIEQARRKAEVDIRGGGEITSILEYNENFIKGQNILIEKQRHKVREELQNVEAKETILLEKAKDVKIFEKLKERHLAKAKKELMKKEQKEISDLILMRYDYQKSKNSV